MKSVISSIQNIGFLTIALTLALAANFAYGQWANPPANPPAQNVAAPINVSSSNQIKLGDITAWNQKAGNEMWSNRYCDSSGKNCLAPANVQAALPSCSTGQILVSENGSLVCGAPPASTPPPATCAAETRTVQGPIGGCSASVPAGEFSEVVSVPLTGNYSTEGNAQFQCFNGAWNYIQDDCSQNVR